MRLIVSLPFSFDRHVTTTVAPDCASPTAVSKPIPVLAPVTKATLPAPLAPREKSETDTRSRETAGA